MPFGMVSGVGRGMGVLDEAGDRPRDRGRFRGEFGAFHCNQQGLCGVVILCRQRRRRGSSQMTLGFPVTER